ncbi:hypothetical protein CASFOL_036351 [Castilleja foliolosa]|uniref:FAF domain-containing protein n=1 Tax=Castilleja foliolosa TaxID=1961234 RepID=A0ABD3BW65_9LAMI
MYNAQICDRAGSESCNPDVNAHNRRRCRRMEAAETEYPPPMPSLACANRPSQMPWVMKRYYSGDGRLVIKEERVRNPEYLQVHRSNGRLVLNLVPLDDVVEEDQGEEEESEVIGNNGNEIDGGDEGISDPMVGEFVPRCNSNNNNNSFGVNTCGGGFGAVVQAAFRPPVHT